MKNWDANNKRITADIYLQLYSIFQEKGWEIDPELPCSIFNRYVKTLLTLTVEQQLLFLDLSRNFRHIPISQYLKYIIPPLTQIIDDFHNYKLYCACCLPKKDIGKIKSSTSVLYQLKGTTIKQYMDLSNVVMKCIDDITNIKNKLEYPKSILILVDDFIGTGETALEAIDYVQEEIPKLDEGRLIIMSIAAMQSGIDAIKQRNIRVYTSLCLKKGISDQYIGKKLEESIKIMNDIELRFNKLKDQFKFGYGQSESLISMERCPNNTFPIYWFNNTSPYERD